MIFLREKKKTNQLFFWIPGVEKVVKIFTSLRNLLRRVTDFTVLTLIFIKDKSPECIKILFYKLRKQPNRKIGKHLEQASQEENTRCSIPLMKETTN